MQQPHCWTLMSSISDRFICDTPLFKFKLSGNPALSSFAISTSANLRRHDLVYLLTSIDALLPSSTSSTLPSTAKTITSAEDAPAVFNADRYRNVRRGGDRLGYPDLPKSNGKNGSGLQAQKEAWKFDGSNEAFKRYLVNWRLDCLIDKQLKNAAGDKRSQIEMKFESDVEADPADCLSCNWTFLPRAFHILPNFGGMAEEANERRVTKHRLQMAMNLIVQAWLRSLLRQDQVLVRPCLIPSQPVLQRRSDGKNGSRAQQKPPKNIKTETKQKRSKAKSEGFSNSNSWASFNPFRFLSMLFTRFVNCVAGSNECSVETLGEACFKLFVDPLRQGSLDFGEICHD